MAAAVVLPGGETRYLGAAADAVYEIGSITKGLTGVLLADAVERGEVALDDPLTRHLPPEEAPLPWPERPPTLAELATHRAGLPNTPKPLARRELAFVLGLRRRDPWKDVDADEYRRLLPETRVRAFGRFRYSSLGFGLLGDALARRAGVSYEGLLRERLCEPLGLADTWIDPPADAASRLLQGHSRRGRPAPWLRDHMAAAGSVRSTVHDLAVLLRAALGPGETPLGPAFALATSPRERLSRRAAVGLGWLIATPKGKAPVVWHNGGTWGFRSFAAFVPATGAAAAVLTNTFRGVERLGFRLLEEAAS